MSTSTIQRAIKGTNCFRQIMAKWEKPKFEKLTITKEAYLKLLFLINLVGNHEVSGFGKVEDEKIVDWYIPKQVLGTLTANIDEEAMLEMMKDIPTKELSKYIIDFHSHNTVGCSPSSTDKESYELQAQSRGYKQFVAMIVNKKEDIWCKCVIQGKVFHEVKVEIESGTVEETKAKEIFEACKKQVEKNCYEEITIKKQEPKDKSEVKQNKLWYEKDHKECLCCGNPLYTYKERNSGYCEICYKDIMGNEYSNYYSQWYR